MHAVTFSNGEVLLYSPTWLGEETLAEFQGLGRVRYLVAPNHYHHLDLAKYRAAFPEARALASMRARVRLEKLGHSGLTSLEDVGLPSTARWIIPRGTKTGEAWLSLDCPDQDGHTDRVWLVCDAFFHVNAPVRGIEGMVLRWMNAVPGVALGATFKFLGVGNRDEYASDVEAALDRERPTRVLFSHGDPLDVDASARLREVLRQRLG